MNKSYSIEEIERAIQAHRQFFLGEIEMSDLPDDEYLEDIGKNPEFKVRYDCDEVIQAFLKNFNATNAAKPYVDPNDPLHQRLFGKPDE